MSRPRIILKDILTKQEYELIRKIYITQMTTKALCIAQMGVVKVNRLLDSAVAKMFSNQDAIRYLIDNVPPVLFDELKERNAATLSKEGRIPLDDSKHPDVAKYLESLCLKEQLIARHYLGIGTGTFGSYQTIQEIMQHAGISFDPSEVKAISQKIIHDMQDEKFRDSYLHLVDQNCDRNLKTRIYASFNEEAKAEEEQKKPRNILDQILTTEEYQLIFSLYFANKKENPKDLQKRMGTVYFHYKYHSALRKMFQSASAKAFLLRNITWARYNKLEKDYHDLPKKVGSFDDKTNPFVVSFLAKLSQEARIIAQNYLGIGTGKFLPMGKVILYENSDSIKGDNFFETVRQILEKLMQQQVIDDYLELLMKSTNIRSVHKVIKTLEEIYQDQSYIVAQKKQEEDFEENFRIKEKARLTANLKRGYLFGDTFLNVGELSEEKALTIKSMTHHEGLLKLSKKSRRFYEIHEFLAIAIFINFENDEKFSLSEIASITGLSIAKVSDLIHNKISDFIALMPEELKEQNAQKLGLYQ